MQEKLVVVGVTSRSDHADVGNTDQNRLEFLDETHQYPEVWLKKWRKTSQGIRDKNKYERILFIRPVYTVEIADE